MISLNFIFASKILAQNNEGIVISPFFSEITIGEGLPEKDIPISISNNTKDPLLFEINIVKIEQTDAEGNISYVDKPLPVKDAFPGFIESDENVYLLPGETKSINIKVKNKSDLSPGGHYIAVIARVASSTDSNLNATIAPALSSFILVTKQGGEIYKLSIRTQEQLPSLMFNLPKSYYITLENQGNVHLTPRGKIEITDIFGRLVKKGIINVDSKILLSNGRRNFNTELYSVEWSYPIMFYNLKITGQSDPMNISYNSSTSFIYISPYMGLIVLAFVALFVKKRYVK